MRAACPSVRSRPSPLRLFSGSRMSGLSPARRGPFGPIFRCYDLCRLLAHRAAASPSDRLRHLHNAASGIARLHGSAIHAPLVRQLSTFDPSVLPSIGHLHAAVLHRALYNPRLERLAPALVRRWRAKKKAGQAGFFVCQAPVSRGPSVRCRTIRRRRSRCWSGCHPARPDRECRFHAPPR